MPMATSPLPWFAHPRGLYQMTASERLPEQTDKMLTAAVMPHAAPTASSPTLSCPPFRFLMVDRREREEEAFGHHSPVPRLPTPEEQREAAKRSASRSPIAVDESSVPLDFSSRPAPSAGGGRRTPDAAAEAGVVDLCTRGSLGEERLESSTAADEEERHNTSRGSSSDDRGTPNVSSEGTYHYHHLQHHLPPNNLASPPHPTLQPYPIHPVALHPHHHHQHFMLTPPTAPRQQSPPHVSAPEGSSAPATPVAPHPANFPGILSLTPPPPVPLHAPLSGPVPHPHSPPQQPAFPALLPAPLHKTLAVAAASGSKVDPGIKVTRPFKAYPKDPLTLTVGVSTAESLLGQASNEAYVEFRKQMLRQVAATKARRPTPPQALGQSGGAEDQASQSPGEIHSEPSESHQQNAQSSASSGDEDGSSIGCKKRTRTNSESSSAPYSVVKDAAYWERRRKNNEAAKRSRDARRAKEDEIAIRAAFLEQENLKLKYEVAALRHETSNLRCLLYSAANSS